MKIAKQKLPDVAHLKGAKLLVTGGTGLIGGYLTAAIVSSCLTSSVEIEFPIHITGTGRPHYLQNLVNEGYVYITTLERVLEQNEDSSFTHIFHLASPSSPDGYANLPLLRNLNWNVIPRLWNLASSHFTFISSGEVYGISAPPFVTEDFIGNFEKDGPRSNYPKSKLAGEDLLASLAVDGHVSGLIVRLFHTFGPGIRRSDSRSFSSFLFSAFDMNQVSMLSNGAQIRTFLHVADAVKGLVGLTQISLPGGCDTFNLGSSRPVSILEFAQNVSRATGARLVRDDAVHYDLSPNGVLVPNTDKLQRIGWREEIGYLETIQDTWRWLHLDTEDKNFSL